MKLAVTYYAKKTIEVECDGSGNDSYPKLDEALTENNIMNLVHRIEEGNASEVLMNCFENGEEGAVWVNVQKIIDK